MSLIDDVNSEIISEFGEEVEVVPSLDRNSTDSGVWEGSAQWDEANSQTMKARVLRTPVDPEQVKHGISDTADAVFYFDDPETVSEGDLIRYAGNEWFVNKHWTKQMGNGPYRQVVETESHDR